jgi:C-terminal processing protease CtpA/Prc
MKINKGAYKDISDPVQFSEQLTRDIQSINGDRHLNVRFNPEVINRRRMATTPEDSIALVERGKRSGQKNNFGFQEMKILDGNIGYLNLTGFFDTEFGGETAQAAMNYFSNADALIIDLRQNGGGSPSMIQLITSYLYGPEPVHLNNFYWRPRDLNTQTWTLPYVPGTRRPDMPVFVLTSQRTFSAAEEFSYNLRNLERATLVGETTGGGAHPGGTRIATERFTVWVPTGRAINPITGTNWEGTGVKPHIEVPADEALDVAHIEALKSTKKLVPTYELPMIDWALEGLEAKKNPISISAKILQSYAGNYGPRTLVFDNGTLYYQRDNRPMTALIPLKEDTFLLEGMDDFRIKILKENNKIAAIEGHYIDGRTDLSPKDERQVKRP